MSESLRREKFSIGKDSTTILVGDRALSDLYTFLKGDVHFLIDAKVMHLHESLLQSVTGKHHVHIFQVSEKRKTLGSVERLAQVLLKSGATSQSTLVTVGGGALHDIGGFLAASFMRGMSLIHVPTTLTAMVDGALGGRHKINVDGKNVLSVTHHPSQVVADTRFLESLPKDRSLTGLAEVIKYGCIRDPSILERLEENQQVDTNLIFQAMKVKMDVIAQDPNGEHISSILNFGHTVAHALEATTKYKQYSHGEAVAIGMIQEAQVAKKMRILSQKDVLRLKQVLDNCGLPTTLPKDISREKLLQYMGRDQKKVGTGIPFVFPTSLGTMRNVREKYIHMISEHTVSSVLK